MCRMGILSILSVFSFFGTTKKRGFSDYLPFFQDYSEQPALNGVIILTRWVVPGIFCSIFERKNLPPSILWVIIPHRKRDRFVEVRYSSLQCGRGLSRSPAGKSGTSVFGLGLCLSRDPIPPLRGLVVSSPPGQTSRAIFNAPSPKKGFRTFPCNNP